MAERCGRARSVPLVPWRADAWIAAYEVVGAACPRSGEAWTAFVITSSLPPLTAVTALRRSSASGSPASRVALGISVPLVPWCADVWIAANEVALADAAFLRSGEAWTALAIASPPPPLKALTALRGPSELWLPRQTASGSPASRVTLRVSDGALSGSVSRVSRRCMVLL